MAWKALKKGDVIDLVAPSHSMTREELQKSIDYVASLGFVPNVPDDLLGEDIFCANTDEKRFEHLYAALCNPHSKGVWCLRGGYGATRLIPALQKAEKPKEEKWFMGFSDITALHLFLSQQWGWQTLHGPVITPITRGVVSKETLAHMTAIMFGAQRDITLEGLTPLNAAAKVSGEINSSVTGGNLSLLQVSVGTDWQARTSGKIVIIEEIDERAYRVDRILTHLKQAHLFEGVAAVIFGTFGNENTDAETLKDIDKALNRFAQALSNIPVLKTDKIGHALDNYPMPINTNAALLLGKKPKLHAHSGVKS